MDIRNHIINNFKDASLDEIKKTIEASIEENDEVTLPGLGVFFEIVWNNSDDNNKKYIINTLKNNINLKS
jgi:small acid-soluble spore protein I (minor)